MLGGADETGGKLQGRLPGACVVVAEGWGVNTPSNEEFGSVARAEFGAGTFILTLLGVDEPLLADC